MQFNTVTTIGDLREGDRFRYPGKNEVWQVMSEMLSHSYLNQVDSVTGKRIHMHDIYKKNTTPVIFLRHTRPAIGEECLLTSLAARDIFYLPGDIIKEYLVIKSKPKLVIRPLDSPDEVCISESAEVVFLRKLEEVKP